MCIHKCDGVLYKYTKLALVHGRVKSLKTESTSAEMIVKRAKVRCISNTSGMLGKSLNIQFKNNILLQHKKK